MFSFCADAFWGNNQSAVIIKMINAPIRSGVFIVFEFLNGKN
jgi:hypothetical protein